MKKGRNVRLNHESCEHNLCCISSSGSEEHSVKRKSKKSYKKKKKKIILKILLAAAVLIAIKCIIAKLCAYFPTVSGKNLIVTFKSWRIWKFPSFSQRPVETKSKVTTTSFTTKASTSTERDLQMRKQSPKPFSRCSRRNTTKQQSNMFQSRPSITWRRHELLLWAFQQLINCNIYSRTYWINQNKEEIKFFEISSDLICIPRIL